MSCRSFFLAVLSLTLGGCAVYDYDNDYYDDYRVHRDYYDSPRPTYRIVEQRYDDRRYYERRDYDGRKDYYRSDDRRYDKRYHDNDRKYRHDQRNYQPRQDNFQERRHDYTPRLQTWGRNDPQPGYRQPGNRQQYRVQSGFEARPHNNPRYNKRSDWSMQNRR
jgi:hypothetical protein